MHLDLDRLSAWFTTPVSVQGHESESLSAGQDNYQEMATGTFRQQDSRSQGKFWEENISLSSLNILITDCLKYLPLTSKLQIKDTAGYLLLALNAATEPNSGLLLESSCSVEISS